MAQVVRAAMRAVTMSLFAAASSPNVMYIPSSASDSAFARVI
jgi:hypothetical protein